MTEIIKFGRGQMNGTSERHRDAGIHWLNPVKLSLGLAALLAFTCGPAVAGTTTYRYDDLGRLVTVSPSSTSFKAFTYDAADNRTKIRVGANTAPTCPSFNVVVSQPNNNPITLAVPVGQGCSDADGDTVVVSAPTTPYYVTVSQNAIIPVTYQATDGISVVSATIKVCWASCS
jgi:YD repeat-containing protein